jgi:hypothetical protein
MGRIRSQGRSVSLGVGLALGEGLTGREIPGISARCVWGKAALSSPQAVRACQLPCMLAAHLSIEVLLCVGSVLCRQGVCKIIHSIRPARQ